MLKQTVYDQLLYLLTIKFDDVDNLKTSHVEYKKSVAFQIGQTYMLLNNIEAYDKQSISEYLFILSDYLYRKETSYKMLNRVKQNFVYKVLSSFSKLELNIREKI